MSDRYKLAFKISEVYWAFNFNPTLNTPLWYPNSSQSGHSLWFPSVGWLEMWKEKIPPQLSSLQITGTCLYNTHFKKENSLMCTFTQHWSRAICCASGLKLRQVNLWRTSHPYIPDPFTRCGSNHFWPRNRRSFIVIGLKDSFDFRLQNESLSVQTAPTHLY